MTKIYRISNNRFDVYEDDNFVGWMNFNPDPTVDTVTLYHPIEVAYCENNTIVRHIINGYGIKGSDSIICYSIDELWKRRREKYIPDYGIY